MDAQLHAEAPVRRALPDEQLTPEQLYRRNHRRQHPEIYRKSAKKFYENNIDACRRKQALTRANRYGVAPREATIARYNLVYNPETRLWA